MKILINEFCGLAFPIELSRELASRGHEVLHLYFADNLSTPKGNIGEAYPELPNFAIEGLHVPMKFSKHSLLTRRQADIAYGKECAARVASFRPDVVLSGDMPLDAQKILLSASRKVNAKFVFWLQDVYSLAVRFVFKRRLSFLSQPAGAYYERLERRLLRDSDAVVCIAPEFAEIAKQWGVDLSRTFVIENWAPLAEVLPTPKDNAWAQEHGVADRFCFMYSGTLGMKHRPELLLELAKYLEAQGDAQLLVICAGAGADWLRENSADVSQSALRLLPFQPYARISEVLGSSDVVIALLDSDAGSFAVPSKVLSYLCSGRPLMLAAPKENHATTVVNRAEAGIVMEAGDSVAFIEAARNLLEDAKGRTQYATNARAYAEQNFSIEVIADRFLDVFTNA